ncbi:hypothetical protein HJG60_011748 [Phyllostomus discolor]|uniref:Uncharacterized protein n=1 Tax=Phyllostomus discolor TaxID=89673 RepID=A0A834E122_9CHIR|nr:hypothetical protein HJG60_011748 [Phyllostomus discolor]
MSRCMKGWVGSVQDPEKVYNCIKTLIGCSCLAWSFARPAISRSATKGSGLALGCPQLVHGQAQWCCPKQGSLGGDNRRIPDSDSAAQLPLPSTIACIVGTSPDQVQGLGLPLHFHFFWLKLALVQVSFLTSQQLCQAHLLWVILEILEITATSLEESPPQFKSNAQQQGGHAKGLCLVQLESSPWLCLARSCT